MKPERKRLLLVSLIIILLSLAYYLSYYKHLEVDVDEGLLIHGAERALDGQLPLKDFHQYMPGRYYVLALWFLVFGKSIVAARVLLVAVHILKNILIFHVARRLMPLPFSLIPVALMLLLPGFWVKTDISTVLLLNAFLLLKYLTPPHRTRHLLFLGLSVGFSTLFREDMAGYSFLTVCVLLLVKGILEKERFWSILRRGVLFSLMILAVMGPVLLFYVSQDGIGRFFQGILETLKLGHIESSPFPPPTAIPHNPRLVFPYLAILLFVIMTALLVVRFRRKDPGERIPNLYILAITFLAVLSFFHIWHWTHEFRIIQTGSLIHVLWAFLIFTAFTAARRWAGKRDPAAAVRAGAFGSVAVLALAAQLYLVVFSFTADYMTQYDAGGISLRAGVHRPIEGTDKSGVLPPIHTAAPQGRVLSYIRNNTAPGDFIYCFGESAFYFLSGRKNPTEFDNGRIPAYFPDQREIFIRQLWGRKPKIIIIRDFELAWWSTKMPEVFEAIKRDYFLDGELFYFYIFTRVSDLDPWIRRGNQLFWRGEVTASAGQYWTSLQKKRDHWEVKKILSRFFFSRELAERCLPVLEGYAVKKDGDTWRLRWGSQAGRRFSGTITYTDAPGRAEPFSRVAVFPQDDGRLRLTSRPGGVLSFESVLRGTSAGLDITPADPAGMAAVRFELFVDGKKAEFVFLNERGLIPAAEIVSNAPSF